MHVESRKDSRVVFGPLVSYSGGKDEELTFFRFTFALLQVVQIALQLAEAECGKKMSLRDSTSSSATSSSATSSSATSSSTSDTDDRSTASRARLSLAGGGDVAECNATSASDRWHFTLLQPSPAHVAAVCVERGGPPGQRWCCVGPPLPQSLISPRTDTGIQVD